MAFLEIEKVSEHLIKIKHSTNIED